MKIIQRRMSWALSISAFLIGCLIWSCGETGNTPQAQQTLPPAPPVPAPGAAYTPTQDPVAHFGMQCNQYPPSAQKKVNFQYQQKGSTPQQSCSPQFQFFDSIITQFFIEMDCPKRKVIIHNQGPDQRSAQFPIDENGKIFGKMRFHQPIQNDGHGNLSCIIENIVIFEGTAHCSDRGRDWDRDRDRDDREDNEGHEDFLSLTTHIEFEGAPEDPNGIFPLPGPSEIPAPQISPSIPPLERPIRFPQIPSHTPSPNPSWPETEPSPDIEPSDEPSDSPESPEPNDPQYPENPDHPHRTPFPFPDRTDHPFSPRPPLPPHPHPTHTHEPTHRPTHRPPQYTPTPTTTVITRTSCVLENPCPMEAKIDYPCKS